jgi:hypothetical protein
MHITRSSEMRKSVTTFRLDITILETWLSLDIAVKTLNCLYTGVDKSRFTVVSKLNTEFIIYLLLYYLFVLFIFFSSVSSSYYCYYFVSLLMIHF